MGIPITPKEFPAEIERRFRGIPREIARGLDIGAMEGQQILMKRTPTNLGETAARWKVKRGRRWRNQYGSGTIPPELHNDAPHVGILELGARPHPVSWEGVTAIIRWAERKLGLSRNDAIDAGEAIAWKLREEGQKGTYFVRLSIPDLQAAAGRGLSVAIHQYSRKRRAPKR